MVLTWSVLPFPHTLPCPLPSTLLLPQDQPCNSLDTVILDHSPHFTSEAGMAQGSHSEHSAGLGPRPPDPQSRVVSSYPRPGLSLVQHPHL